MLGRELRSGAEAPTADVINDPACHPNRGALAALSFSHSSGYLDFGGIRGADRLIPIPPN
jgi:hypothetical protein